MTFQFRKAEKRRGKLRLGLVGPSGSGKTYTALRIATGMAEWYRDNVGEDLRIALIDTEAGEGELYADEFEYATLQLDTFAPATYVSAIKAAVAQGFGIVIPDSLSHAWVGKEGALQMVDDYTARSRSKNAFTEGWREVTPEHNELIDTLIRCGAHIIATMRTKTEWVMEENERGKKEPRRIGLAPIQRSGMEYEFTFVGDVDLEHKLVITKSRWTAIDQKVIRKPGQDFGRSLMEWLNSGTPDAAPTPVSSEDVRGSNGNAGNGGEPITVDQEKELRRYLTAAGLTVEERTKLGNWLNTNGKTWAAADRTLRSLVAMAVPRAHDEALKENAERSKPGRSSLKQANQVYRTALLTHAPDYARDAIALKQWEIDTIGRPSAEDWSAKDYMRAVEAITKNPPSYVAPDDDDLPF